MRRQIPLVAEERPKSVPIGMLSALQILPGYANCMLQRLDSFENGLRFALIVSTTSPLRDLLQFNWPARQLNVPDPLVLPVILTTPVAT
jgi:hypothetical protein